ncbi:MAG TPA: dihydrolipoamide acetyltransferase family protein [Tepidisphaeraceae bacterium]|nr:dihydrolipoamide acetyltransferase family protein [Tepidisphaeraceae bacterium]
MPTYVNMPQLSDTMTEGKVVKWVKKEGESVSAGTIIAEVETDKAVMEMESFDAGSLAQIVAREGDTVAVGKPIAVMAVGKESVEEARKWHTQQAGGQASSAAAPSPAPAKAAPRSSGPISMEPEPETEAVHQPPVAVATAPPARNDNGERPIRVSPLARRMAAEKGIDVALLHGSGPNGRVIQRDVADFKPAAAATLGPAPVGSGKKETIELTKMRLAIAKQLALSKQSIPHFYETVDVDVQELSHLREGLNKRLEKQNVRVSLGDFVSKAVAMALVDHPALNATFDGTTLTRYGDVHLGMAVAIPDGLIVPVLRNIQALSVKEIRQRSVDLVERARAQRLKRDEMTGATFTVSNLGAYGVREFSAIINPPEVGILAVGGAAKRAVVRDEEIVARTMMTLTLSADHRVVDGATAAEFLRTLKTILEEPGMMWA